MSEYSSLKATINANVKTNNNQEITGSIMNSVLNAMVNSLGVGYQFIGVATPTNPVSAQTPDYKCFYLATTPGTYTNLGGLVVADGEVAILKYYTSWTKEVTGIATADQLNQLNQKVLLIDAFKPADITSVGQITYTSLTTKKLFQCVNFPIINPATDLVEIPYRDGAIYTYNGALYRWNGTDLVEFNKKINKNLSEINETLDNAPFISYNLDELSKFVENKVITGSGVFSNIGDGYYIPLNGQITAIIHTQDGSIQYAFLQQKDVVVFADTYTERIVTNNAENKDIILSIPGNAKYLYVVKRVDNVNFNLDGVGFYQKTYFAPKMNTLENLGEIPMHNNGYIDISGETANINSIVYNANFSYSLIPCTSGDSFKVIGQGGQTASLWAFVDENGNILERSRVGSAIEVVALVAPNNSSYLVVNAISVVTHYIYKTQELIKSYFKPKANNYIVIAASDSVEHDKKVADYVCTGVRDERVINNAIAQLKDGGTILLLAGNYYIGQDFIYFGANEKMRFINLIGVQPQPRATSGNVNANICVEQNVLNSLSVNATYSIISGTTAAPALPPFDETKEYTIGEQVKYNNTRWECIANTGPGKWDESAWAIDSTYLYSYVNSIRIENINIRVASNSAAINPETGTPYGRKIIGIDCRHFGTADIKNVLIETYDIARQRRLHLKADTPIEGSIGVYSLKSSNDYWAEWTKVRVNGFYIGFMVRGVDHLIATWCDGCRCCYAFYFGGSIHKCATLINCADEGCTHLPYFGGNDENGSHIEIMDYCIEPYNDETGPNDPNGDVERQAIEQTPGNYYGSLVYNMQGVFPGIQGGSRFWKNGSGHEMVTRNLMNPRTRRSGYPEYLERVFEPTTGKWSTYNGSEWIEES